MLLIQGFSEVMECEALALFEALMWVRSMGYEHVIFETDSQVVAKAIDRHIGDNTKFEVILIAVVICYKLNLLFKYIMLGEIGMVQRMMWLNSRVSLPARMWEWFL